MHVGPVELDALQENLSNDIFAENPNCHCLQLPERSITVCSLSNSLILHSCSYDCHYVNVMVLLDCRLYMVILLCSYKSINIMFHYCVLYVQIELYARQCFVHFVWMSIYLNCVVQFWESLSLVNVFNCKSGNHVLVLRFFHFLSFNISCIFFFLNSVFHDGDD